MVSSESSGSGDDSSQSKMRSHSNRDKQTDTHLPSGYELYELQLAGHHSLKGYDEQLSVLHETDTGYLLKPFQTPPRGERERKFYADLSEENLREDETLRELASLTPKYYGSVELPVSSCRKHSYIRLENLTAIFQKPCVMDVKIGARTWDPEADDEKIAYETEKYPWLETLGFRFLGMKVFYPSISGFKSKDKHWGKKLPDTEVIAALDFFFVRSERERNFMKSVVDSIIEKISAILSWFQKQRKFIFYSSSLLIIYEGDGNVECDEESERYATDVKMIDFSHVFPSNGEKDINYIAGLNSLKQILADYRKTF